MKTGWQPEGQKFLRPLEGCCILTFSVGWNSSLLTWIQEWQISGCSAKAPDSFIVHGLHAGGFHKWFPRHSNHGLWEKESGILACQVLCGNFLQLLSSYCPVSGVLSPMEVLPMYPSQVCKAVRSLSDFQRFHYIIFREFWENSQINISTLYKDLMTCVFKRQVRKRKRKT